MALNFIWAEEKKNINVVLCHVKDARITYYLGGSILALALANQQGLQIRTLCNVISNEIRFQRRAAARWVNASLKGSLARQTCSPYLIDVSVSYINMIKKHSELTEVCTRNRVACWLRGLIRTEKRTEIKNRDQERRVQSCSGMNKIMIWSSFRIIKVFRL